MAEPYPKSKQLARGERRYRRKVASPKQWQAIIAAKGNECRQRWPMDRSPKETQVTCTGAIQYHHLVSRADGGGDVADNIIPLCERHHDLLTRRVWMTSALILRKLSDAEYAYMIDKGGEDYPERAYGIRYAR